MAKLSAYGRTLVYEVRKTVTAPDGMPLAFTHRLMSDGVVLERRGQGWGVRGRLKAGTPEQWLEGRVKSGWTKE